MFQLIPLYVYQFVRSFGADLWTDLPQFEIHKFITFFGSFLCSAIDFNEHASLRSQINLFSFVLCVDHQWRQRWLHQIAFTASISSPQIRFDFSNPRLSTLFISASITIINIYWMLLLVLVLSDARLFRVEQPNNQTNERNKNKSNLICMQSRFRIQF